MTSPEVASPEMTSPDMTSPEPEVVNRKPEMKGTTKAGRHDIAEILLNVALNTKNKIIIKYFMDILMAEITYIVSPLY
jgi:hypothetical protein